MASKRTKTSRLSFSLKRFAGFMKLFLRNKRAALGLFIIFGFAFLAVAAPILTPFNALGQDPTFTGYVAGKYAAPLWLKQLPTWLGGNPALSENMEILKDPSAPKLWPEGQLNYTELNGDLTDIGFDSDVNYRYDVPGLRFPNRDGSLAVSYHRDSGTSAAGESKLTVFTEFYNPWGGIPGITLGNLEILVNGTRRFKLFPKEQWLLIQVRNNQNGPRNISLSLVTNSQSGLYIAATADVTKYFGTENMAGMADEREPLYWKNLGYRNWQEWLNGTDTLPHHWNNMSWLVSEGSITTKTYDEMSNSTDPRYLHMYDDSGNVTYYTFMNDTRIADPDLNTTGNYPDIYRQQNWTITSTVLASDYVAGALNISVASVEGFDREESVIIGSAGREEANMIKRVYTKERILTLYSPILTDRLAGEPVIFQPRKLGLLENVLVQRDKTVWIAVKFVLTDPDIIYSLKFDCISCDAQFFAPDTTWPFPPWNPSMRGGKTVIARKLAYLKVPVKVRVFLGAVGTPMENMTTLFPIYGRVPTGFNSTKSGITTNIFIDRPFSGNRMNDYWILTRGGQNNYISYIQVELVNEKNVLDNMELWTQTPGRYRFGIELTFTDRTSTAENVSTTVYIDDLALKLLGTSYGILGTDQYGQDLFSQLIYGTRISLYIGLLVAVMSVTIGVAVGLVSGYMGGAVDQALMRFNDLLLVLPGLPLLIVLVAVLGARIENLILLMGLLGWNGFARVVRSQVLSLKERPFIEAAKAAGAGTGHIIVRHILPNVMALVYVSLATSVPGAITAEAALAWLGFYDPTRMSWGRMLHEVFVAGATRNWWWIIPPGLCIALIATAFILLGYALDEVLNPKLRMRR